MKHIYLNNAGTALPDQRVLDAAAEFVEVLREKQTVTEDIIQYQTKLMNDARSAVAGLIHCSSDEIALVNSTSHAMGTIATALQLQRGDNILACDLEYQASIACWHPRAEQVGFTLKEVKSKNGRITAEDFERYIDKHTKVILLASVQEINGFRADVAKIARLAHEHGCYLIVDGIQEVGALTVDVKALDIDFYCAGGKKWIGNPFGMGFLYIRKELLQELAPPYYSYFDVQVPEKYNERYGPAGAYLAYLEDPQRNPFDPFPYCKNATVFEAGGYTNHLGAFGLGRAIDVLNEYGSDNIEKKVRKLTAKLRAGLKDEGFLLSSPEDKTHCSGIVTFTLHDLQDLDASPERKMMTYLAERGVHAALRCSTGTGGIRLSPHYYTSEEDIDSFLQIAADYKK